MIFLLRQAALLILSITNFRQASLTTFSFNFPCTRIIFQVSNYAAGIVMQLSPSLRLSLTRLSNRYMHCLMMSPTVQQAS